MRENNMCSLLNKAGFEASPVEKVVRHASFDAKAYYKNKQRTAAKSVKASTPRKFRYYVDPSLKTEVFVNTTGRPLKSFGIGAEEAAAEVGRIETVSAQSLRTEETGLVMYNSAVQTANYIAWKYPKSTVLCQGDFGYTLALATALCARGCKAVYTRTFDMTMSEVRSGKTPEFKEFMEYGFTHLKRTLSQPKKLGSDSVVLNFTSHPVATWPEEQVTAVHVAEDHVIDARIMVDGTLSAKELRASVETQVKAVLAEYPNAFAAVIQGEWTVLAAGIPLLINANVRPLYGVADRRAMLMAGTKRYIFGGFREYMVCGR